MTRWAAASLALSIVLGGASGATELSSRCAPLYNGWQPIQGTDNHRPTPGPKPVRGQPFADATYKTCVVRATDHTADKVPGFARTDYARRESFNSDNTRFVASAHDGSWHQYDARTLRWIGQLPDVGGDPEPQWHPTNPKLLYYLPAFGIGMQIRELDVTTGKTRVVADLGKRLKKVWPGANSAWTKSEGSPSADARYWAFMIDDADWHGLGMVTYDLVTDQLIAGYDWAKNHKQRPDHVSMSPSGNFVTASFEDGTYAFPRDFAKATKLHHKSEHSDLALDTNGDDVYVSIDYEASKGPVFMINLRTGVRTTLFPTYLDHTATAIHFSGKAFARPGWVLASTYAESGGQWEWLHGKIFAFELKENPRIVNVAHHHVAYDEYFTEPHATVSRDFTRILFNSNWDVKSKLDVDSYLIELPANALPR